MTRLSGALGLILGCAACSSPRVEPDHWDALSITGRPLPDDDRFLVELRVLGGTKADAAVLMKEARIATRAGAF